MSTTVDYSAQVNNTVQAINDNYSNYFNLQKQLTAIATNLITIFFATPQSNKKVGATNTPVPPGQHTGILENLANDPQGDEYVCYNFQVAQPQIASKNNNYYCGLVPVNGPGTPVGWYCTQDLSQLYINSVASYNSLMQQLIGLNTKIYTQEQSVTRLQGQQSSANSEATSLALSSPAFLQYRLSLNAFYVAMVLLFLLLLIWYINSKAA